MIDVATGALYGVVATLLGDNVLCIVDEEEGFVLMPLCIVDEVDAFGAVPLCIVDAFGADTTVAGADAAERPASI